MDGGPTRNGYLMQFQSDIAHVFIRIPDVEELPVIGVIFLAGMSSGLWEDETVYHSIAYQHYGPKLAGSLRAEKLAGWSEAVERLLR